LTTIVNNYPNVELYLWDYKRVELALFREARNTVEYLWDTTDISKALEQLYQLVLDRFDILTEKGLTIADNSMNPILVVCEEISLMSKTDMKILRKIMAISRAVKVYVLFTTQRPSHDILDNTVKSLVSNRICLKTEDTKNSIIALDSEGCEQLKGKGHGYIKSNGYITEFQSYFISDTLVNNIVAKHSKVVFKSDRDTFREYQNKAINGDLKPIDNINDKLPDNTDTSWLNRL
jgi:S-DNA-T family DNA segregation ATPase FtsK/SpoIIIE